MLQVEITFDYGKHYIRPWLDRDGTNSGEADEEEVDPDLGVVLKAGKHTANRKPLMVRCLECVHALSVASSGGTDLERRNLPGIATATRKLAGDAEVTVGLDPHHDLLVGQAGMGIGGRFRRPLMDGDANALLRDDDTLAREGAFGEGGFGCEVCGWVSVFGKSFKSLLGPAGCTTCVTCGIACDQFRGLGVRPRRPLLA